MAGAEVPEELKDHTEQAYRTMLDKVLAMRRHPWWAEVAGKGFEADKALRAAASAQAA